MKMIGLEVPELRTDLKAHSELDLQADQTAARWLEFLDQVNF